MTTATQTHTDLHCSEGLCTACLPMESEHFSPCFCACHLTITEREPIIIEGCLVPFEIYDRVKAYAVRTGQWQFIGVRYEVPSGDNPLTPGNAREPINWEVVGVNLARVRENMRAGRGLIFVLDKSRPELIEDGGMAVILWISPQPD